MGNILYNKRGEKLYDSFPRIYTEGDAFSQPKRKQWLRGRWDGWVISALKNGKAVILDSAIATIESNGDYFVKCRGRVVEPTKKVSRCGEDYREESLFPNTVISYIAKYVTRIMVGDKVIDTVTHAEVSDSIKIDKRQPFVDQDGETWSIGQARNLYRQIGRQSAKREEDDTVYFNCPDGSWRKRTEIQTIPVWEVCSLIYADGQWVANKSQIYQSTSNIGQTYKEIESVKIEELTLEQVTAAKPKRRQLSVLLKDIHTEEVYISGHTYCRQTSWGDQDYFSIDKHAVDVPQEQAAIWGVEPSGLTTRYNRKSDQILPDSVFLNHAPDKIVALCFEDERPIYTMPKNFRKIDNAEDSSEVKEVISQDGKYLFLIGKCVFVLFGQVFDNESDAQEEGQDYIAIPNNKVDLIKKISNNENWGD
jgi:hypothetical protein